MAPFCPISNLFVPKRQGDFAIAFNRAKAALRTFFTNHNASPAKDRLPCADFWENTTQNLVQAKNTSGTFVALNRGYA